MWQIAIWQTKWHHIICWRMEIVDQVHVLDCFRYTATTTFPPVLCTFYITPWCMPKPSKTILLRVMYAPSAIDCYIVW